MGAMAPPNKTAANKPRGGEVMELIEYLTHRLYGGGLCIEGRKRLFWLLRNADVKAKLADVIPTWNPEHLNGFFNYFSVGKRSKKDVQNSIKDVQASIKAIEEKLERKKQGLKEFEEELELVGTKAAEASRFARVMKIVRDYNEGQKGVSEQ